MKKNIILGLMLIWGGANAVAGEHSNALSQCLRSKTTEADKVVMTKWVYSSLSNHPSLGDMVNMSDAVKVGANREMAQLVEKFIYDKCYDQLKSAVKNEGLSAIEQSIRSYVEVMSREVMQHPSISNSVTGLAQHLDPKKLFEAMMAN